MKLLLPILLLPILSFSQPYSHSSSNPATLASKIKNLDVCASVLYVAAHPDDENTGLLAFLANQKGFCTNYLSLTRGDGGQNLIGKEQGVQLGIIRTQELLAARSTDGASQKFTRAFDFGYSKKPEETLKIWDKQQVLEDFVWIIRQLRPDVIITRFNPEPSLTHGHHTASAMLALEAFSLAADSSAFPEQLKFVKPFAPKRVCWNTSWFFYGTKDFDKTGMIELNIGLFNPMLGLSYGEIEAMSRSKHSSQGFGTAVSRGDDPEYFKFLKGSPPKSDLFEGVVTDWSRVPESQNVQAKIKTVQLNFNVFKPYESVPALVSLINELNALKDKSADDFYIDYHLKQTESILTDCLGLYIDISTFRPSVVPGDTFSVKIEVINRSPLDVSLLSIKLGTEDLNVSSVLMNNLPLVRKTVRKLSDDAAPNTPYWLNKPVQKGMFVVDELLLRGQPVNPDLNQTAHVEFTVDGLNKPIVINRPLVYKWVVPEKGEQYRRPEFLPAVSVRTSDIPLFFTPGGSGSVTVRLTALKDWKGRVFAEKSEGWEITPKFVDVTLTPGVEVPAVFQITAPENPSGAVITFAATDGKDTVETFVERIEYDHIPIQTLLLPSQQKVVSGNFGVSSSAILYVAGAGDDVAPVLSALGYRVKIIQPSELPDVNLKEYRAIVTGVRAFNVHDDLTAYKPLLNNYMKEGGTLLVQYNTNSFAGPLKADIGPYAFKITRDRITDENSPVRFLLPSDPVLNSPNKIVASDFDGWIQERGIYFAGNVAPEYRLPLAMNDPLEKELTGALIVAPVGKGKYVYTGLSFFRQLPTGNPGAIKLFVNLIESKN